MCFFSTDNEQSKLAKICENVIENRFGLAIRVAVFSAEELTDWLSNAPPWWDTMPEAKHNAIFVIPPMAAQEVMAMIGDIKPEYEAIGFFGQLIFRSAPLATFSRTRLTKIVHTSMSESITARNANTAKKLAKLAT